MLKYLKREIVIISIVLLCLFISFTSLSFSRPTAETSFFELNGETLYVGGNGPGNYSSIQDAINNSNNGDIIFVYNGVYSADIIVNKSIILSGENRETTIIQGGVDGFLIEVNNVKIKNFTITNCGQFWNHYAIRVNTNYNIIQNNKIVNNKKLNGIFIEHSNNNLISGNYISDNPYIGIRLEYANNNMIINNYVNDNEAFGMSVSVSSNNVFISNTVSSNLWGGISVDEYCENNHFYHNNFINNDQDPADQAVNLWDDGYPSGGNYWTEYGGCDDYKGQNQDIPGPDGIGDTPYDIPGECSLDRYPLMRPYGLPDTPIISGETKGKNGVSYEYGFYVNDSNDKSLYLRVDWGTGSAHEWSGPYESGTNVLINHTWMKKGDYDIRAQVKNTHNLESGWGRLSVNIPRYRDTIISSLSCLSKKVPILQKLFQVVLAN